MKITILDIVKKLEWEDVKRAIKYFYPIDKNNYESLFYELRKYRKQPVKDKNEVIKITCFKLSGYALKQKDPIKEMLEMDDFYSISTNKFSISFRKWRELVNLPISEDTLNHYKFVDIIAMFIWEITFYGNEKETKKTATEIFKAGKEISKQHKLK